MMPFVLGIQFGRLPACIAVSMLIKLPGCSLSKESAVQACIDGTVSYSSGLT